MISLSFFKLKISKIIFFILTLVPDFCRPLDRGCLTRTGNRGAWRRAVGLTGLSGSLSNQQSVYLIMMLFLLIVNQMLI